MRHWKTAALTSMVAASALALTVRPAAAEGPEEVSLTFRMDLAQMETAEGVASTYRDLQAQAREACRQRDYRAADWRQVDNGCMADLVNKVVAASNAPSLVRLHAEATGQTATMVAQTPSDETRR